jgi:hypothetical protein
VQRLTATQEFDVWLPAQAEDAAYAEFEAVDFQDLYQGYENDPEGSADECLSYWDTE